MTRFSQIERIALWAALAVALGLHLVPRKTTGSPPVPGSAAPAKPDPFGVDRRLRTLEDRLTPTRPGEPDGTTAAPDAVASLEARVEALEKSVAELATDSMGDGGAARVDRLTQAIARGDLAGIAAMLAEDLPLEARDALGRTPLATAAIHGRLDVVDILLARGASLETRSADRDMTPLLTALDADQEEIALALLERGARRDVVDSNGESPLMWAAFNGLEDVVTHLLAEQVDVDHQNHQGATALYDAVRRNRIDIVRLLLDHGAAVHLRTRAGKTALSEARERDFEEITALLEAHGAR
jgi:hypothetical protein